MLVLKGLVGLQKTVQLCFFRVTGWGIDLDYRDTEWFALETNRLLQNLRSLSVLDYNTAHCRAQETAMLCKGRNLLLDLESEAVYCGQNNVDIFNQVLFLLRHPKNTNYN